LSKSCRANREHWKTLFQDIYGYFIKNPVNMPIFDKSLINSAYRDEDTIYTK